MSDNNSSFSTTLICWYQANKRDLPWRKTTDPYIIWISEVILQQTRVDQGISYFNRFIDKYPTVQQLSAAKEQDILNLWQGLGYYSRARNLHFAAKSIVKNGTGVFPNSYEEIKKLKGVGDYTAAAIASFAFQLPHPVIDGNVKRVVTRYFGIKEDISKTTTLHEIDRQLHNIFSPEDCDSFNQAIMEFGALQCIPKNPNCKKCIFNSQCNAFLNKEVNQIPVNKKKIIKKHRYIHYYVLKFKNTTILNKRVDNDIWKNMFDFPSIEKKSKSEISNISEILSDFNESQINSI